MRIHFYNANGRYRSSYDPQTLRVGAHVGSLIDINKKIRSSIFHRHGYIDIDQVKCHPTLMLVTARLLGMPAPALESYIDDPDALLAELCTYYTIDPEHPVDMSAVKRLVTRLCYGGGQDGWIEDMTKDRPEMPVRVGPLMPDRLRALKSELDYLLKIIAYSNPMLSSEPDMWHRQNAIASRFLWTLENHISYLALEMCIEAKLMNSVPLRDGGGYEFVWGWDGFSWIPSQFARDLPEDRRDPNAWIPTINEHIVRNCGQAFDVVKFIVKEIPQDLVIDAVCDDEHELWRDNEYRLFAVEPDRPLRQETLIRQSLLEYPARQKEFEEEGFFKVETRCCFARAEYHPRTGLLMKCDMLSKTALETMCMQYQFTGPLNELKEDSPIVKKSFIPVWMKSSKSKTYLNADCYPPPLVCPKDCFNTWTSSPYHDMTSTMSPEEDAESVRLFNRLLDIITGLPENPTPLDIESRDWFLYFLAHMIQRPAIKPGYIVVLGGSEGTGKSLLGSILCALMGKGRFIDTKMKNIVGDFNSLMDGKILCIINELVNNASSVDTSNFKSLITDDELTINPKNVNQYQIKSYHRFICTTNDVAVIESSRRPYYYCSNLGILQDEELGDDLWKLKREPERYCAIYRYLQDIDLLTRFVRPVHENEHLRPPNNDRNREMHRFIDREYTFLNYLLNEHEAYKVLPERTFSAAQLFAEYEQWKEKEAIVETEHEKKNTKDKKKLEASIVFGRSWLEGSISEEIGGRVRARKYNLDLMRQALALWV
jgi:hypothetical protein